MSSLGLKMGLQPKGASLSLIFLIVGYCLTSSTLLILNKVTLYFIPAPNFVLILQLLLTAFTAQVLAWTGKIELERLEWKKLVLFSPAVGVFFVAVFLNMKALQAANVEAVIVFRCSTPLIVAVCEYLFMDRELPSLRSWLSMILILAGAVSYAVADKGINVFAYEWLFSYLAAICFDMLYIKHVTDSVPMSTWGRVYYNNILSVIPAVVCFVLFGEWKQLSAVQWTNASLVILAICCAVGVGISSFAWALRSAVSALSFTVIGVLNKLLTVLINISIWDQHAPPPALAALVVCIAGSSLYQQPPKRSKQQPHIVDLKNLKTPEESAFEKKLMKEHAESSDLERCSKAP